MGQYRLSIYAVWQLGLTLLVASQQIIIHLPFMSIHIATTKHANGVLIFNKYFNLNKAKMKTLICLALILSLTACKVVNKHHDPHHTYIKEQIKK